MFEYKNLKKRITIILVLLMMTNVACSSRQIINYGVEVVESEENESMQFSFEKDIETKPKSNVVTKKERDYQISTNIENLIQNRTREAKSVKGVYLPAYIVGDPERFNPIFENIKKSCINAIVVDVKDDHGRITYNIDNEFVKSKKTIYAQIKDIEAFVNLCKANDIYIIARVVTLYDSYWPRLDSSIAIHRKDGKYYKDYTGSYWLNPYNDEVKKYLIEIGKGCAKAGFDEVQYDYFRFSGDSGMKSVVFSEEETRGRTSIEVFTELAQDIYQELIKENVFVSIDVFGSIINSYKDQTVIGQEYTTLLKNVDYICPMIYPSHYANKTFGLDVPDLYPYDTIKAAMETSNNTIERTYDENIHYGKVRPWLQGFTAEWLPEFKNYSEAEYKEQIKAVEDLGFDEWLFWHAGGKYKWEAFIDNN